MDCSIGLYLFIHEVSRPEYQSLPKEVGSDVMWHSPIGLL